MRALHSVGFVEPLADHPQDWIEALAALRNRREACALVVVTQVKGSGPRDPGARMVVSGGRLAFGTIGGGNLEKLAIEHASELLRRRTPVSETVAYPLSEAAGQCCGGEVTVFYETFPWTRRRIAIFGAGHVAQALGGLAPWLSADVVLIDPREEREIQPALPARRPYELMLVDAPEAEVDGLPDDALLLVMTHSHALDLEILARAVLRDFPYVGLIGSARKWARFQKRLAQRGISDERIARVRCPIGLSKRSKEPSAIALSVAAELADVMAAEPAH
ncbi:MAG: xanthine dehydrogenase accessory protein XdhC [Planctomycetota bacterium]|nr:xanthine dehydrogenase accessory protein XdhC [Planctomycetota bacterium]